MMNKSAENIKSKKDKTEYTVDLRSLWSYQKHCLCIWERNWLSEDVDEVPPWNSEIRQQSWARLRASLERSSAHWFSSLYICWQEKYENIFFNHRTSSRIGDNYFFCKIECPSTSWPQAWDLHKFVNEMHLVLWQTQEGSDKHEVQHNYLIQHPNPQIHENRCQKRDEE